MEHDAFYILLGYYYLFLEYKVVSINLCGKSDKSETISTIKFDELLS